MKSNFFIYIILTFLIPFNGLSQETDTLPSYFHLEHRLGDCAESLDFMRLHLNRSKSFIKLKSNSKHSVTYKLKNSLKFDQNKKGISDLHKFYIDLTCLKSMRYDSVLNLFVIKKVSNRLTNKIKRMDPKDTLSLLFDLNNSNGFILHIVNKNIVEASWNPSSNSSQTQLNIQEPIFLLEDSLPSKYYLNNRVLNCFESYEFMKNCIDKNTKILTNFTPNDNFERVRVSVEILNERKNYRANNYVNKFDYAEFYFDLACLQNEHIEKVLSLFLKQENVKQVFEKIERLKYTDYVLILLIDVKFIATFGIRIEHGKISSISWPAGWEMY